MVKARDRVRVGNKVKKDEDKRGWPKLELGTQVVGRDPTAKGHVCEVAENVHGRRTVFIKFHRGGNILFARADIKKDTGLEYKEEEKDKLEKVWKG